MMVHLPKMWHCISETGVYQTSLDQQQVENAWLYGVFFMYSDLTRLFVCLAAVWFQPAIAFKKTREWEWYSSRWCDPRFYWQPLWWTQHVPAHETSWLTIPFESTGCKDPCQRPSRSQQISWDIYSRGSIHWTGSKTHCIHSFGSSNIRAAWLRSTIAHLPRKVMKINLNLRKAVRI